VVRIDELFARDPISHPIPIHAFDSTLVNALQSPYPISRSPTVHQPPRRDRRNRNRHHRPPKGHLFLNGGKAQRDKQTQTDCEHDRRQRIAPLEWRKSRLQLV